jgi:hypothetical protein
LSCCRFILPRDTKKPAKRKRPTTDELHGVGGSDAIQVDTDMEDKTFTFSVSKGGCNDDSLDLDSNGIEIGNNEVWIILSRSWYKLILI